jgi:hypothetical protein
VEVRAKVCITTGFTVYGLLSFLTPPDPPEKHFDEGQIK